MQNTSTPIVVDLGTVSRKRIRELKGGRGQLDTDVRETLAQIRERVGAETQQNELVPVVVVYSRKRKKRQQSIVDKIL